MILKLFTQHPESVGESYFQHLVEAMGFAGSLLTATVCCFCHALMPFLFTHTGSDCISRLNSMMESRRRGVGETEELLITEKR